MKNFKYIMTLLGICLTLSIYVGFFVTFFDENVSKESSLLTLVIALQLTTIIKQDLKNN